MEQPAITILNAHRVMAVSTVRPDGWPQTTIVGYANEGFDIYFLIFRSSQKFANIAREPRISLAIGDEPRQLDELQAVYVGAIASEVTDPVERRRLWQVLAKRHPNLESFDLPEPAEAAVMRAECRYVSVLDFTRGLGHSEALRLTPDGPVAVSSAREDWSASLSGAVAKSRP